MPDSPTWVPVYLGDVRVGDTVKARADSLPPDSRYADYVGTVVGIRFGSLTVRIGDDSIVFQAEQLDRLERPE